MLMYVVFLFLGGVSRLNSTPSHWISIFTTSPLWVNHMPRQTWTNRLEGPPHDGCAATLPCHRLNDAGQVGLVPLLGGGMLGD